MKKGSDQLDLNLFASLEIFEEVLEYEDGIPDVADMAEFLRCVADTADASDEKYGDRVLCTDAHRIMAGAARQVDRDLSLPSEGFLHAGNHFISDGYRHDACGEIYPGCDGRLFRDAFGMFPYTFYEFGLPVLIDVPCVHNEFDFARDDIDTVRADFH